jgi:hypothetical protein
METQPRTATPPSRKPHYADDATIDGSCGVTTITDRPFVLVILGQTLVSMRQMRRLTHQRRRSADRGEYRQAAGAIAAGVRSGDGSKPGDNESGYLAAGDK